MALISDQHLLAALERVKDEIEQAKADEADKAEKADKTDTVLETTLSRGRKSGTTVGTGSFAFGLDVTAIGAYSHAEGSNTDARGENSHAEGNYTYANGSGSHAEGYSTVAGGECSHTEGYSTSAEGNQSHAEGRGTIANHSSQHVAGEFNVADPASGTNNERGTYVEIIGNGTSNSNRSNARTLDWDGNEVLAGTITANGVNLNNEISGLRTQVENTTTAAIEAAEAAVPETVTAWLDEHITEPEYPLDDTLTVQGAAADAKKVGDEVSDLKSASKQTRNLLGVDRISFTKKQSYTPKKEIPAGTYTISFEVATTDTDTDHIRVSFYRVSDPSQQTSSRKVGEAVPKKSDGRISATFTASDVIKGVLFYAGTTDANSEGDTATYTNVQIEAGDASTRYIQELTAVDAELREIKETEDDKADNGYKYVNHVTNGHVRHAMEADVMPMDVYEVDNGTIKKKKTVIGSDYIRINPGDIVNVCSAYYTTIDNPFYLYFYNKDKEIDWNVLSQTETDTNEKNHLTFEELRGINGLQFSGFEDVMYVRFSHENSNEHGLHLLIWDGEKCGIPVTAAPVAWDDGEQVMLDDDCISTIQVPKDADFIIAKPGYTLKDLTLIHTDDIQTASNEGRLPAQCVHLKNIHYSGRYKNIGIVKNYDYETDEYDDEFVTEDLSDKVIIIENANYSKESDFGYATNFVKNRIKKIMNFTWEAMDDVVDNDDDNPRNFVEGTTYHGVPYRSGWNSAHFVGWHATKHTFINAANDPDSIFYNHNEEYPGPYYSNVCSSFGSMVCAFPKPNTNFGFMRDPYSIIAKPGKPMIGTVMTNSVGHCLVPMELCSNSEDQNSWVAKIAEQNTPLTQIRNVFGGIKKAHNIIGPKSIYLNNYEYSIGYKKRRDYYIPYDVTSAEITGGTARPHRGDRSVYTSAMDVVINIKDADATRLYYQKFSMECQNGVPDLSTKIATGDPLYIALTSGTDSVVLRSKDTAGSHTGVNLSDGGIYAVWASVDGAQQTVPDNAEYFEWHDIGNDNFAYQISNGVFHSESDFWYVVVDAKDEKEFYDPNFKSGLMTILHRDKKNTDGSVPETTDYSDYSENAYITKCVSVFKKGALGAYCIETNTDVDDTDGDDTSTDSGTDSDITIDE